MDLWLVVLLVALLVAVVAVVVARLRRRSAGAIVLGERREGRGS